MQNEQFLDAAWVTLRVAVISSTIATVLGTMAAYALVRGGRFFGRTLFSGMIYAPLVMPEVLVADVDAAGERHAPVRDDDLAVVAEVELEAVRLARRRERLHLRAGAA